MNEQPQLLPLGKPSYEGLLHKRSEWLQQWRLRFFKLYLGPNGPRLYFCKDKESPPHGAIDLRQCLTVKSADDKTGKKNSFEVSTSEQHFFMYADTAQEKDEVSLCACVFHPSFSVCHFNKYNYAFSLK